MNIGYQELINELLQYCIKTGDQDVYTLLYKNIHKHFHVSKGELNRIKLANAAVSSASSE